LLGSLRDLESKSETSRWIAMRIDSKARSTDLATLTALMLGRQVLHLALRGGCFVK
jgi:hypothetical protein